VRLLIAQLVTNNSFNRSICMVNAFYMLMPAKAVQYYWFN
jgi:hypothetical protein